MSVNKLNQITAIMVLYDTDDIVFKCLENLKNIKIIIADNGKNKLETIERIKSYKNIIKYFKFKKNIGYGRANNFCQKFVKTEYTLLIEPDVLIKEDDILRLVNSYDIYPDAGILMPTIKNEKNEIIDRLTNLPEHLSEGINKDSKIEHFFHGDVCINFDLIAIMLFKNSTLNKYGLFNRKFFIYWEDCYLCRWYKKNNLPIIKIFNSQAIHYPGKSTQWNFLTKLIGMKHYLKSSLIYYHTPKEDSYLKKRFFLYLFRTISYLLILNFNNSVKNFAKFCAVCEYMEVFKFHKKLFKETNK